MYKATLNDDELKYSLTVSAGLHFLMLLFLYFGLPHLIPPLPSHHEPVPFEIVTIADITNTRIDNKPEEKPAPPPAPAAQKPPEAQQAPKTMPTVPNPPKVEAEALMPKPMEKPKPPPVEKPAQQQQPDLLGSVLKNVAKLKPAEPTDQKTDAKNAQAAQSLAPVLSQRLTISEEDALRRQIEQCWNPPVGARDAQSLVVEVLIDVNADRTVANADIVDKTRYATDSFFRAAADSAIRAVRNPKCSPLELNPDKYETWKRIDFTFDPRDML